MPTETPKRENPPITTGCCDAQWSGLAAAHCAACHHWSEYGRPKGLVLTLDDGRRVILANSSECCAHTYLEKFLLHPERVDHAITGVASTNGYTKWHIFADLGDILELDVEWSAGNAFYYGYGFDIAISNTIEGTLIQHELEAGTND